MSTGNLSERVQKMTESATIAMSQKSRKMKAQGLDVISLSLGEPDFNTPDIIKNAAKTAIDENHSKYTPVAGTLKLRQAIAGKLLRENQLTYAPDEISVSTGAKQAIMNVILSLVNPGDEVILPAPYWVSYIEQVKFAGGIPVIISTRLQNDFKITADELSSAITSKTKLIIYSSPCNPSGSVYSKEELDQLSQMVAKHPKVYLLSDEIYEYINFTEEATSIATFPRTKEQTITVNGVAKGYAMTGWRIGYAAGPKWLIAACNKIQGQFTSGANAIAQQACVTALNEGAKLSLDMKASFLKRRNLMFNLLKQIPGIKIKKPNGAFYLFPDVSNFFGHSVNDISIKDADDLCEFLLTDGLVALVSGTSFGNPNCIRISYASSDEKLIEAARRIKKSLEKLSA